MPKKRNTRSSLAGKTEPASEATATKKDAPSQAPKGDTSPTSKATPHHKDIRSFFGGGKKGPAKVAPVAEAAPSSEGTKPVAEISPSSEAAEPIAEIPPSSEPIAEASPSSEVTGPIAEVSPKSETTPNSEATPSSEDTPSAEATSSSQTTEPNPEAPPSSEAPAPTSETTPQQKDIRSFFRGKKEPKSTPQQKKDIRSFFTGLSSKAARPSSSKTSKMEVDVPLPVQGPVSEATAAMMDAKYPVLSVPKEFECFVKLIRENQPEVKMDVDPEVKMEVDPEADPEPDSPSEPSEPPTPTKDDDEDDDDYVPEYFPNMNAPPAGKKRRAPKKSRMRKEFVDEPVCEEDLPVLSEFEQKRLNNLRENKDMLAKLMQDLNKELGPSAFRSMAKSGGGGGGAPRPKPKQRRPVASVKTPLEPMRRNPSRRARDGGSTGSSRSGSPVDDKLALGFNIMRRNNSDEDDESEDEYVPEKRRRSYANGNPRTFERDLRAPEEITEEELDNIAERSTGKTYCQVRGSSCHQCRQKTIDTKTICRGPDCWGVRGQFCGPCLRNRYGEEVKDALLNPVWECPPCRGICNCSFCRARQGKACTGILIHLARDHGYHDVNSFLMSMRKKKN